MTQKEGKSGGKKQLQSCNSSHEAGCVLWALAEILNFGQIYQTVAESDLRKSVRIGPFSGYFRTRQLQICNTLIFFCTLDQLSLELADG